MRAKQKVWVLTITDERETLGEKATVSLHKSLRSAQKEMRFDMVEVLETLGLSTSDVEYEPEAMYAQTKDQRCSWYIEQQEV